MSILYLPRPQNSDDGGKLASIGMQVGGVGAPVPERRKDLAELGVGAMLAGTIANLISAPIEGMFLVKSSVRRL